MSELVIAQKQDLINIADAIREKTDTTDGIGLDAMASLISAIEKGAKIATGTFTPTETVSCSAAIHYEGSEVTGDFELVHGFGSLPIAGMVCSDFDNRASLDSITCALFIKKNIQVIFAAGTNKYGASTIGAYTYITDKIPSWCGGQYNPVCFFGATNDTIRVVPGVSINGGFFVGGKTYRWILIGE